MEVLFNSQDYYRGQWERLFRRKTVSKLRGKTEGRKQPGQQEFLQSPLEYPPGSSGSSRCHRPGSHSCTGLYSAEDSAADPFACNTNSVCDIPVQK